MAAPRRFLDDHGVVHLESDMSMSSVPVTLCQDIQRDGAMDIWRLRRIDHPPTCLWCVSWQSR